MGNRTCKGRLIEVVADDIQCYAQGRNIRERQPPYKPPNTSLTQQGCQNKFDYSNFRFHIVFGMTE